ncbi:FKBP-type peptidyl-prolyl cis-trans isomerase [Buchnera aphidicola (Muscaphis stroyani)]|uniref:Peptidyl-prolyl cis-trans isomerase n=2 Tax=Buchnera aphidicola TaxID=9 RepID=A0A4D6YJ79_9GAMM|nr:FKBP-type peptidyl-prolyl cis-trans isomerase [Buchnera aphidicola (Muscaphis stroyani)]
MFFFLLKRIMFLCIIIYTPQSFSALASLPNIPVQSYLDMKDKFHNNNDKLSYSLGVSLGNYINQSSEKQKKIGIILNKKCILLGVQDSILNKLKLSNQEIISILQSFEEQVNNKKKIEFKKEAEDNLSQGTLYINKFSRMKNVIKTSSGLLYAIEKRGEGEKVQDNSKITVHYKGTFIDGKEFDNSYKKKQPLSLFLKDVIFGWQEGLKYIHKGGKIKLIIPPYLAYGEQGTNNIPSNSTVIFDIELLDVTV